MCPGGGIRNFIHPYLRLVELDVPHIEQLGFGSGLPDPDHPVPHANAQDTGVKGVGGEAVDEPVEGRQGVQQLPVPKEGYNKELRVGRVYNSFLYQRKVITRS